MGTRKISRKPAARGSIIREKPKGKRKKQGEKTREKSPGSGVAEKKNIHPSQTGLQLQKEKKAEKYWEKPETLEALAHTKDRHADRSDEVIEKTRGGFPGKSEKHEPGNPE